MSWHHAAWCCELHLPVSTCGMTDVLFHRLLRMFLAHTPTNVIVCQITAFHLFLLYLFSLSFSGWFRAPKGSMNYMCVHISFALQFREQSAAALKPIYGLASVLLCVLTGSAFLPKERLSIRQHKSRWRFVIACDGAIKDGTVKLSSGEKEKEQLRTRCQSQGLCVLGGGGGGSYRYLSQLPPISLLTTSAQSAFRLLASAAFFFSLQETAEVMKMTAAARLLCRWALEVCVFLWGWCDPTQITWSCSCLRVWDGSQEAG